MSCLDIEQIHLYLDGDLGPERMSEISAHLETCSACRGRVERRREFEEAARSLPLWELPRDFTRNLMARLYPEQAPLRTWLVTAAAGVSLLSVVLFTFFLLTGDTLGSLLLQISRGIPEGLHTVSVWAGKGLTLFSALVTVIRQLGQLILQGLGLLTSVLNPQVQVGLILLTMIISAGIFLGLRRVFHSGDRA